MGGPHENAVYRAGFHAECAEHALGIINREAGDLESLAVLYTFLADVDAVHRADLGTLVAGDAGGQVEAVETSVTIGYRDGLLRILKSMGPGVVIFTPVGSLAGVRLQPVAECDPHATTNRTNRLGDVVHPLTESTHDTCHLKVGLQLSLGVTAWCCANWHLYFAAWKLA